MNFNMMGPVINVFIDCNTKPLDNYFVNLLILAFLLSFRKTNINQIKSQIPGNHCRKEKEKHGQRILFFWAKYHDVHSYMYMCFMKIK